MIVLKRKEAAEGGLLDPSDSIPLSASAAIV
jgi:hypothetical protein